LDDGNEAYGGLFLYKDDGNWASITSRSLGGTLRFRVFQGGSGVYNDESAVPKDKDVKIEINLATNTIKFKYWDGDEWIQQGTDQVYDLGTPLYLVFSSDDFDVYGAADVIYIDNAYLVEGTYDSQYPPAEQVLAGGMMGLFI